MSNPERGEFNSVYAGLVGGIFVAMIVGLLFTLNPSNLMYILWIGMPILFYILCISINFITQNIVCNNINAEKALLGGLPAVGAAIIGLGLSWVSYCRIPVASVFAPLFVGGDSSENSTPKNATPGNATPGNAPGNAQEPGTPEPGNVSSLRNEPPLPPVIQPKKRVINSMNSKSIKSSKSNSIEPPLPPVIQPRKQLTVGGANNNGSDNNKCCQPMFILEKIEQESPGLKGISYAFYLFFSMIFGTVIGNSMATVC